MNVNWQKFKYNAFVYAADIENPVTLRDDGKAYILQGWYADEDMTEFVWAADAPEPVLEAIGSESGMLSFLPRGWVAAFEGAGFSVRSVFRDYWKKDLSDVPDECALEKLTDAAEAAAVANACAGQSRGFTGATAEVIREWMGGSPEGVRNAAVLGVRDEAGILSGVVMTGLYGDGSEKGPVAWVRMVAVRPDRQNRGLGRVLVKAALSYGKRHGGLRAFLAADDENKNGIHLYESLGFVPKADEEEIAMWRRDEGNAGAPPRTPLKG